MQIPKQDIYIYKKNLGFSGDNRLISKRVYYISRSIGFTGE